MAKKTKPKYSKFIEKRTARGAKKVKADVPPLRPELSNPDPDFAYPQAPPPGAAVDPRLQAMAQMKPTVKVMVAVPTGGHPRWEFCHDLANFIGFTTLKLVATGRVDLSLSWVNGCYVAVNRNDLAVMALEQEATHILYLDDDMRFPPWALEQLLARKTDIVAANYTTRKMPIRPVTLNNIDWEDGSNPSDVVWSPEGATGLQEVDALGGGVLLVDTDVFVKLEYPFFEQWYDRKRLRNVGEDVDFCKKAQNAGYKVYIDHDLSHHVRHIGVIEHRMTAAWEAWQEMRTQAAETKAAEEADGSEHIREPEDGDRGLAKQE
jgi:hypothetical protein